MGEVLLRPAARQSRGTHIRTEPFDRFHGAMLGLLDQGGQNQSGNLRLVRVPDAVVGGKNGKMMQLYNDQLSTPDGKVSLTRDLVVRVEGAEVIEKRVTATRVALIGPWALLAKKPKGSVFVCVENGSGFFSMLEVHAKKRSQAIRFAARANAAAKRTS